MLAYPIELTPDDNDTLLVTCPDLPEVATFGEDQAEAVSRAIDALEEALASRIAAGEPIPPPSPVRGGHVAILPGLTAAKVELYRAATVEGLSIGELGRRLGLSGAAATALVDLNRPTSLQQLEAAFRALGKRLEIIVRDAA